MRKFTFFVLIFPALMIPAMISCGASKTAAEKEALAEQIRTAVEKSEFTFNATYVHPTGYRSMSLSPRYDVRVKPDTVVVFLPYFGRAYTAPIHPDDGGIKHTGTDFEYSYKAGKKKGNWSVDIKFNDSKRDLVLFFDIWENGTSRLTVSDTNRQSISFSGDLTVEK